MDTCSNCGTSLRSGAKFCTTCGARQNPRTDSANSWSQPEEQSTQVIPAITPDEPAADQRLSNPTPSRFAIWGDAYGATDEPKPKSTDDPASRFISALERNAAPAGEPAAEPQPGDVPPAISSTWATPSPSAFTPPTPVTWNWEVSSASPGADDETGESSSSVDDWRAPSTWAPPTPADEPQQSVWPTTSDPGVEPGETASPDAGINSWQVQSEPDTDEATAETDPAPDVVSDPEPEAEDAKNGVPAEEENLALPAETETIDPDIELEADAVEGNAEQAGPDAGDEPPAALPTGIKPAEARLNAIAMVDELRIMLRMMDMSGESDKGRAAMTLTEASLAVGNYDDLRSALTEVMDDPRDIQALAGLSAKVDRIEALLNEHQKLVDAIEDALKDLAV